MDTIIPKISVVTVSYNAAETIEETILSVINQSYDKVEYIIIDGGSTDGTVDIIRKYATHLAYWVSEPDKGIYDAMNKGIDAATGDYINFMNSGDCFATQRVLSNIFELGMPMDVDVIFGDVINKYSWGMVKQVGRNFNGKESRLPFSHQSVFVKSDILKKYHFNLKYKSAADHDLIYRLYCDGFKFKHIDLCVAIYDVYGVSSTSMLSYREVCHINGMTGLPYYLGYAKGYIRAFILNILPSYVISAYQKLKYRWLNKIS